MPNGRAYKHWHHSNLEAVSAHHGSHLGEHLLRHLRLHTCHLMRWFPYPWEECLPPGSGLWLAGPLERRHHMRQLSDARPYGMRRRQRLRGRHGITGPHSISCPASAPGRPHRWLTPGPISRVEKFDLPQSGFSPAMINPNPETVCINGHMWGHCSRPVHNLDYLEENLL